MIRDNFIEGHEQFHFFANLRKSASDKMAWNSLLSVDFNTAWHSLDKVISSRILFTGVTMRRLCLDANEAIDLLTPYINLVSLAWLGAGWQIKPYLWDLDILYIPKLTSFASIIASISCLGVGCGQSTYRSATVIKIVNKLGWMPADSVIGSG